jgi:hypothetical protein
MRFRCKSCQRGSPAERDPRFDSWSNRDLLIRRLSCFVRSPSFGWISGAPIR